MNAHRLKTSIGNIAVYYRKVKNTVPILFVHGVYFDHHLWDDQTSRINDRTVITVDMPLHGESGQNVPKDWNLADCGKMLLEILNALDIPKVIAIGHSWGSMTILRASHGSPERFQSVGFCNMPFKKADTMIKAVFTILHLMIPFRNFYTKQIARSFYGKEILKANPELVEKLRSPLSKLSKWEIKQIDRKVITGVDDATYMVNSLKVMALALKGKEDYVPTPSMPTTVVEGGHISPLEVPEEVFQFIRKVVALA